MDPASILPNDTLPYVVLMGIGFVVGAYGQAGHFPWITLAGILIIVIAAAAAALGPAVVGAVAVRAAL